MDPFIGEIRPFAFNFAPQGWAICAGQLLPIAQNTALFSLLGTSYGGNGTSTFALPNLQGFIAIGAGQGAGLESYVIGETGGVPAVTLLSAEVPPHGHTLPASSLNNAKEPAPGPANCLGDTGQRGAPVSVYIDAQGQAASPVNMLAGAVSSVGGSLPHNNMAPYLVINYCIALQGVFPPRS